jgi:flagellar assembly factor FliW
MVIESTRFGELEIDGTSVLELPDGLIGLPGTGYALITTTLSSPFNWLHSIDHPELALPVTNPWLFFPEYEVRVPDEDARRLDLDDATGADILCVVRAAKTLEQFTINLAAPIVVNTLQQRARQIINDVHGYSVAEPLLSSADVAALEQSAPTAQAG